MHTSSDRVCYSSKGAVAEDSILRLSPWFATASKVSPALGNENCVLWS